MKVTTSPQVTHLKQVVSPNTNANKLGKQIVNMLVKLTVPVENVPHRDRALSAENKNIMTKVSATGFKVTK